VVHQRVRDQVVGEQSGGLRVSWTGWRARAINASSPRIKGYPTVNKPLMMEYPQALRDDLTLGDPNLLTSMVGGSSRRPAAHQQHVERGQGLLSGRFAACPGSRSDSRAGMKGLRAIHRLAAEPPGGSALRRVFSSSAARCCCG
jgi:hypothetical protein